MLVRTGGISRDVVRRLCAALTLPGLAAPAAAQPAPPAGRPEEVIVITGSRIPRPNLNACTPVTLDSRQHMKNKRA
jgi:hypothetical protein